jgi:tRNA threonylcarbamoyladenosine biosynthesis protein TsaB
MKILACDTALGALTAAVIDGDRVLAHEFLEMSRGHAEQLAPMVERVMHAGGLAFRGLDRLAVTTGPGTFTGQRVGIAFMRAAALALKIPLAGITTLEAMAAAALEKIPNAWAAVVADARRGEIYLGAYTAKGETLVEPSLVPVAEAIAILTRAAQTNGAPTLAGTASENVRESLRSYGIAAEDSGVRQPEAIHVAHLASSRPAPSAPPKPLYLRAPDAKLPA